jgi:EAL domain-containing protein (putative c-di-GMP-specific phosphodiesterase class I)
MKMVKELGKKIVVEGVENQEMVDILKSFGCDYMQGYFFSKPVPAEDYMKFLDEKN